MQKAVVIGNFDGVHRGHAELLSHAVKIATASALEPVVLTFDPHPARTLGRTPPPLLTRLERKIQLIERLGAKVCVQKFDAAFAALSPDEFATTLLRGAMDAKQVFVGYNFRFGKDRAGDVQALGALGEKLGFSVEIHARVGDETAPWSSTRTRQAILRADMKEAARVLGRFHSIEGVVVSGRALGRTIGFPTANLDGVLEMLPPNGVYAVLVDMLDEEYRARILGRGVMNIGTRPTVAGAAASSSGVALDATMVVPEVHLTEGGRDLYGEKVRVHLVEHLREERKFQGIDALKAQIEKDRDRAIEITSALSPVNEAWQ